ncbi:Beta-galactosidase [Acidisarcina polymorpha]|uniref:beta-galactosidase n=1 Tax=Acidisarcina polymorpha TaxID=2211140 RepID=A0A2Z5FZN2_9BACT|nr:glycoside hydrolase family 2 TIM barrel-domain containing protein [Acidisarcina polymorpha]AXC12229.1 Beta-galactosidase [Acidisarcina polymorpha]
MGSLARFALMLTLCVPSVAHAVETEVQYLSGLGKDDPVKWQFLCDHGPHANHWSTIGVPSNWELQGFGIYTYGRVTPVGGWTKVHGVYKRTFTTPATWRDEAVILNFEGVMTDTRVTVNGQSAGPLHQGGYYAFHYDITSLLKPAGQPNEIQVDVDDESSDASVNRAERRGDFWNYAGIFRPVYLEAVPKTFIEHLAVNATAAGVLEVDARLADRRAAEPSGATATVEAQVFDLGGKPVGEPVTLSNAAFGSVAHLAGTISNPRLWTAETPNLYRLDVRLKVNGAVVHTVHQKFGFRTIEVRPGNGLFVNGNRIFLKGVDRHSFWPDSGRTLSEKISRDDINLIKELNGNAVRSSHYSPDRHFLNACDELGLYVLDELTGWQAKYDTGVGRKLVKELVEHDVNHPSILFWDNGNEGGFNFDLDADYAKYDPQARLVLHPWSEFPVGIADTKHYPTYQGLQQKLAADPVLFPTEMLHGLYDGGAGAGMQDYWDAILKSKAGAGGFVWALVDEDVKRVDKGGILDSQGNYAPDGIVGPYREHEASFNTIKQLWSPIIVTPPAGGSHAYTVTNRYSFLDAGGCTYEWQAIAFRRPSDAQSGSMVLTSRIDHGRSLAPGASAAWDGWGLPASASGRGKAKADATRLIIRDATGRVIQTYVWPVESAGSAPDTTAKSGSGAKPAVTETPEAFTAKAGDVSMQIDKSTGLLVSASRLGHTYSLKNGPRVVAMRPRPVPVRGQTTPPPQPSTAEPSKLVSLTHAMEGDDLVISAAFDGPMRTLRYRLKPNGWLSLDYVYAMSGPHEYFGIGFDYPEAEVKGMRFFGQGPDPVYQNRLAGGTLDVWQRSYNNTMVGDPDDLKPGEHFDYPVFKGFYSGVRWVQFNTTEGEITAAVEQQPDSPIYLQVFAPKTASAKLLGQVAVPFPSTGLSFLNAIPAIGNKFGGPQTMGPMGQSAMATGEYKGHISLYFGQLPKR